MRRPPRPTNGDVHNNSTLPARSLDSGDLRSLSMSTPTPETAPSKPIGPQPPAQPASVWGTPTQTPMRSPGTRPGRPPATPPPPAPPESPAVPKPPRQPVPLRGSVVAVTIAAAFFGNLALRQEAANTLVMALFFAFSAAALYTLGYVKTRSGIALLAGAVIFGGFMIVRTEPRLIFFDIVTALMLLIAAATFGRGDSIWDLGPIGFFGEFIDFVGSWLGLIADGPADIGARFRVAAEESSTLVASGMRVLRGLVLALPIVILFGVLLASADIVFASLFDFDADFIGIGLGHLALMVVAGSLVIAILRKSSRASQIDLESATLPVIGKSETMIVLGSLNLLFAIFVGTQIYAGFGQADQIIRNAGLSYSDYARQGFFQLLWVAGLTLSILVVISTLRPAGGHSKAVINMASVSGVLTVGIIGVALNRLLLYIGDRGLTPLRFYSSAFSVWIAVAFLIVLLRLAGVGPNRAWLMPALVMSAMTTLFGLNVANPESIIASHNLARQGVEDDYRGYGGTAVLGEDKLSSDGIQVLIGGADGLPLFLQADLEASICRNDFDRGQDRGWTGFNISEASAQSAKTEYCS